MSTMQGNPHFSYALDALGDRRNDPAAAATLALAYETRTANLIAVWNAPSLYVDGVYDRGNELAGVSYGVIAEQIKTRLGLGPTS